jgi:hypothetical protein
MLKNIIGINLGIRTSSIAKLNELGNPVSHSNTK